MGNSQLLLLIFLYLISAVSPDHLDLWVHGCSTDYGNYTSNSTYKSNLDTLLAKISTTTDISYGYYNFSAGQDPDQAYAIALCRGDVGVSDCHTCLDFVKSNLTSLCPNQMEAIGWADYCMLRYSSRRDILGGLWENSPTFSMISGTNATDMDHFANGVEDLLRTLTNKTANGDSRLKFATGDSKVSVSQKVYALTQCTPDLVPTDCLACLHWALDYIEQHLRGKTGARALLPSCSIRYESHKFYLSADPPPPSSPSSRNGKKRSSAKLIVRIAVLVTSVALLLVAAMSFLLTNKRRGKKSDAVKDIEICSKDFTTAESLQYDLKSLQAATKNFSDANKLGEGGFGGVYRGKLQNGQEIAVKRLSQSSSQGAPEFKNEVVLVAKLQHRNLVRLLGFCLAGDEKLLVYEYVPNKSLDYFLFAERQAELDWTRR